MQPRTLEQIATVVGGEVVQGDAATVVTGVTTDSRQVAPGRLFVPLRGARHDGHEFIGAAFQSGASAALVARAKLSEAGGPWREHPGFGVVAAADTLHALQLLAADGRRRLPRVANRVVAVTGSVGKTTTKDMVAAVTASRLRTTATKGNFNNEIGLPLTLLDADEDTEVLVLEMGMRGVGEIRELARIARPVIGIVTNVSEVHLGPLGTVERIAAAKRELVEELPPDGTAILNGDDARVRAMAAHARCSALTFGFGENNDVRAVDYVSMGAEGSRFTFVGGGRKSTVRVPTPGRHSVYNALAAGTAAFVLGLDEKALSEGLARFADFRSDMRLHFRKRRDGALVIDDAYNAGPASMGAALDVLAELPPGRRRIAVLGDMLELGEAADRAHERLGRRAVEAGVDVLIAVGSYGAKVVDSARRAGLHPSDAFVCGTAFEAAVVAERVVGADDAVLVKASRGVALEVVVQRLLDAGGGEISEGKEAPL